jgi:hypothetical protein
MPLPVTPRSREQTGPWVQSDIDAMPDWDARREGAGTAGPSLAGPALTRR